MTNEYLRLVVAELKTAGGIDLAGYRKSTLERRVAGRIAQFNGGDVEAYLRRLKDVPGERDRLIETITISVTSFFRNPVVFEVLAQEVLPELIERKLAAGSKELRVWSAGCSTGEEPYTVAMLLDQVLGDQLSDWSCLIFATDLDRAALEHAKVGVFEREQLRDTKLGLVDTYFEPCTGGFELRSDIRARVGFSRGDLTSAERVIPAASVFGSFDLVLCRNVLIYYSRAVQAAVFEQLRHALAAGGFLVLGEAETLSPALAGTMQPYDRRHKIFRTPRRLSGTSTWLGE